MKKYFVLSVFLSLLLAHMAGAQNSEYTYKPKQQAVADDSSWNNPSCNRPKSFDQLLGEKVVFTPLFKVLQKYG